MPIYTHRPLSPGRTIRILLLQPHHDTSAPIQIKLEEASLSENKLERGGYEALSYVWGSPTGDQPIECDGDQLLITENCLAALRSLRFNSKVRKLWVDAICINQNAYPGAVQEKNHQLKLMGDVYARAQRVLIWLGKGDDRIVTLMDQLLRTVPNQFTAFSPDAIADLVGNTWFNRAWTLQELCYAQDPIMVYDRIHVPWEHFVQYLDWKQGGAILDVPKHIYGPFVETTSFVGLFRMLSDPSKLKDDVAREPGWTGPIQATLFGFLRSRESSRPEDKIYAFHQILTDIGFVLPDPDISRSVAELYEETTYLLIEQARSLKILEYLPSKSIAEDLPSWVPDYSQPFMTRHHIDPSRVGTFRPGQTIERIQRRLKLKAVFFDAVVAFSDRMPDLNHASTGVTSQTQHETALQCYETIYSWMKFVVEFEGVLAYDQYADDFSFLAKDTVNVMGEAHAHASTKLADIARLTALAKLVANVKEPTEYENQSEYLERLLTVSAIPRLWVWLNFIHDPEARSRMADTHLDPDVVMKLRSGHPFQVYQLIYNDERKKNPRWIESLASLEKHFSHSHAKQALFATKRGLLGLAVGEVQQGDVIALFPGSVVPMLLRAVEPEKRVFRMVGPSSIPDCPVAWSDPKMPEELFEDVTLI